MAERLLSPELMQSRRVLAGVDPVVLAGTEELPRLAARLEAAACAVSSAPWARLLVRRRVPGTIFSLLHDDASPISIPLLTAGLARRPWGLALDDRAALPHRIVRALAALRDVHGIALLLYEPDGTPAIVARHGEEVVPEIPPDPAVATVTPARSPQAWLPLTVGGTAIGGLCVQWSKEHVIREHERRLLAVYASGAAMALEHARLYERARIQAERDPVTDLYNQ